ncbi:hypothetical protein [Nostoc sp.]
MLLILVSPGFVILAGNHPADEPFFPQLAILLSSHLLKLIGEP